MILIKNTALALTIFIVYLSGCSSLQRANPLDTTTTTTSATTTTTNPGTTTTTTSATTTTTNPNAPSPPTGVTARPIWYYTDEIEISWYVNTEPNLSGYNVYKSTSEFGTYGKINSTLISNTLTEYHTATGLIPNTVYYFKVTAVNTSSLESAYSAVATSESRLH